MGFPSWPRFAIMRTTVFMLSKTKTQGMPKTLKTSQYAADERLIAHVVVEFRIYPPGVFQSSYKAVSGSPGNMSEWKLTPLSSIYLQVLSRQALESPDGFLFAHLLFLANALHSLVEDAIAALVGILLVFSHSF